MAGAGSSSDEESDDEWTDFEEEDEDEDAIDLEGFDDGPPPLVTRTLPEVSSSPSQSSSAAAKDTNESNNNTTNSNSKGRPTWNGKVLYPPSNRNVSNPSVVWKLSGFVMVKGKLQLSHAICGICGREVPFTNSPGNMRKHLSNHHPSDLEAVEKSNEDQSKASSASQSKLTDFMNYSSSKTAVKYQASHPKQKKFRQLLVRWIVASKRSFKVVEDQGFIDIINLADSALTVPCARTVSRDIEKLYKEKVKETIKTFEKVESVGVTTDAGSSSSGKTFIDINCHWIDEQTFEAKKKTIEIIKVDSKKAKDYLS